MSSGLTPSFSSNQQNTSASFANPLQSTPLGSFANNVAQNLPQTYSGTPIRNFLGFIPTAYAAGNTTQPTSGNSNTTPQSPYASYAPNASYGPPAPTTTSNNNNSSNSGSSGNGSVPNGFQPTDEWARANTGMSLANYLQQNPGAQAYMQSQQNSAAQQAAANITAATNQYNNLRAQLQTQQPVLQSAYQTGLSDLNNQLQLGQQQGQANSAQLTSSYNAGMGQLGQQHQVAQAQNRELARAVGGNGSDYAQLQNQSNNAYQNNQFQSANDYQSRLGQINQGLQSLHQWGASQQHGLATQYQQGINQLVLNENMTDFSKAQAIQQIQSDYSKQLANINGVVAQFGNQLALAKAQVDTTAMMFGRSVQGYDPLAREAQMFYGSLGTQAPTVNTSGGISYPTNNNTAGGINNNNSNVLGA